MKLNVLKYILFILIPISSFSQFNIKGKIVDEKDKAIEYVNVLLKKNDKILKGTISDTSGNYLFKNINNGNYLLYFTSLNYKDTSINVKLDTNVYYLCKLINKKNILDNVEIVAKRPIIINSGNKTIVKLNKNVLNNIETTESVFKYIPGMIKTKSGYQLFGKDKPLILINGKPASEIELNTIQPQNILKIEMFDNNGKYDASVQYIINIIIIKKKMFGAQIYNGLRYKYPYFINDFRLYLIINKRKLQQSIYYNNGLGSTPWEESSINNFYDNNSNIYFSNNFNSTAYDFKKSHNLYYALNYDIDTLQSIGLKLNGNYGIFGSNYNFISHINNDIYNNITKEESDNSSMQTTIDYNLTFKNQHSLSIITNLFLSSDATNTKINQNTGIDTLHNTANYNIYSIRGDYSFPIKSIKTVCSVGTKIFQTINKNTINDINLGNEKNQLIEKSYAGYILFSNNSIKNMSFELGLRGESFTREINNTKYSLSQFKENKVFPSLSISYKLNSYTNISFNYKNYIDRSAYSYITNQNFYINPYLYKLSNPSLQPDIINSLFLNISFFNSIQFNAGYKNHNNYTTMFFSSKDDSIIVISYDNTYKQEFFLSLSTVFSSKKSYTNIGVSATKPFFKYNFLGEEKQTDKINYNLSINNMYSITKKLKTDISFQYFPLSQHDLFLYKPIFNLSIGLIKFFFNKQFRVSIYYDYNSTKIYQMQFNRIELFHTYSRNKNVLLFSLLYKFDFNKKWIVNNNDIETEINRINN